MLNSGWKSSSFTSLYKKISELKGDSNPCLVELDKREEEAQNIIAEAEAKMKESESQIDDITAQVNILNAEYKAITADLDGLKKEDYKTLLEKTRIYFNPEDIITQVNRRFPESIKTIEKELDIIKDILAECEENKRKAEEELSEVGKLRDDYAVSYEQLNGFIDLILEEKEIDASRTVVEKMYQSLGLSKEEAIDAAIETMFPERGFREYFSNSNNGEELSHTSTINLPIDQFVTEISVKKKDEDIEQVENIDIESKEEELEVMDVEEIDSKLTEKEVKKFLAKNKIGENFDKKEIDIIIKADNLKVVEKNIAKLKGDKVLNELLENATILVDGELLEKIKLLRSLGKSSEDIKRRKTILAIPLKEIETKIKAIKNIDPKKVSLGVFEYDVENLNELVKLLKDKNIVVSENDLEKYGISLVVVDLKVIEKNLEKLESLKIINTKEGNKVRFSELGTRLLTQDLKITEANAEVFKKAKKEIIYLTKPAKTLVGDARAEELMERVGTFSKYDKETIDSTKGLVPYVYDDFLYQKELAKLIKEQPEVKVEEKELTLEKTKSSLKVEETSAENEDEYMKLLNDLRSLSSSDESVEIGQGVV